MTRPKILFVATEDWFVDSHFLPLVRRAREDGYEVVVAARDTGAYVGAARLAAAPFERRSMSLSALFRESRWLRALIERERPDIVHAIALRPIALALLACGRGRLVLHLTGRGYLAAKGSAPTCVALAILASAIRHAVKRGSCLLVENPDDRRWLEAGRSLRAQAIVELPGAGVDTDDFLAKPEPTGPLVVGLVARLVRSKGIDLAVDAIVRLRSKGHDISLHVAGSRDLENPEHVSEVELARWRATPGVVLCGRVADVSGFWAKRHIAVLPSRGGEGLPRSLLEAASSGRPIITTDVPGCRDFVVDGETGLVVAPNDVLALADAIETLAGDADSRQRMGAAGRKRVVLGFTEMQSAAQVSQAWRALVAAAM